MSPRIARGRKQSVEFIRELVSLLGSLSRTGDSITLETLASRLGVSEDEARTMMDIVCQASGEDTGGLLISSNDEMTEFTLQYPTTHGRPLRLTHAETIALVHALDLADIPRDDPIRTRVRAAFSSLDVDDEDVRKALGTSHDPTISRTIMLCARARAAYRMVEFLYSGIADQVPRERCALIRNLRLDEDRWYADAYDLDALDERTFRLDRMQSVSLGPRGRLPEPDSAASEARLVDVVFRDPSFVTLFDWPGLRITHQTEEYVEGTMPYYAGSDWLLRRIAACGGTLTVSDASIMRTAREYARALLAEQQ